MENEENNPVQEGGNKVVIKSFNKKRRNMSVIWFIGLLAIGVLFLIAGVKTFTPLCTAFGVISFACGVIIIVSDVIVQNGVYEIFTPEYYVHVKNGKEGERVFWNTVTSVEHSALMNFATSRSQIGKVSNFVIDYKIKDESGNYVLKRALAYVPPEQLTLVQSVVPFPISGGKYMDMNAFDDDNYEGDFEWDEETFGESAEENGAETAADTGEEKASAPEQVGAQSSVSETAETQPFPETNAEHKSGYIKMPPAFRGLMIYGAILAAIAAITFIVYAFVPLEPLVICAMIGSFAAVLCIELANFNTRAIYRYTYNPYMGKIIALCAVLFCVFLGTSVYAIVTYNQYIPKLICIIGFALGTVVFLAETLYFAIKKYTPPNAGKSESPAEETENEETKNGKNK